MRTGPRRRTWAVLGEMGELGADSIIEHDSIGRLAVRLDVSRLVIVDTGRATRAMHQGAVMEGSWGDEAVLVPDAAAAVELLTAEVEPGDVVLVKASQSVELHQPGRLKGNIETPSLSIDKGVIFEGSCKMETGGSAKAGATAQPQVLQTHAK